MKIPIPLDADAALVAVVTQINKALASRVPPKFSKTNLPPATPAGQTIWITEDLKEAYADGSAWRWKSDDTVVS